MKPGETNQLSNLEVCLKDIRIWLATNVLLLDSDKTEVTVLSLAPSTTVRNLGVLSDHDLSFNCYSALVQACPLVLVLL